ncbi:MAG: hypothetical protein ABSG43_00075 [Solirubrobacteraceae bacterium]|jgi:hypothetical protein
MGDHEHYLEPDQLVAERSRPLPRAALSARVRAGLWALRVVSIVLGAMVVYVFVVSLGH